MVRPVPHLNVLENVAFGLRREHLPDRHIRQKVGEMLALVELQDYERRRPRRLSGEAQQSGTGRAEEVASAPGEERDI